jgi:cytoskeletal protein CcmA (bactofilin family)
MAFGMGKPKTRRRELADLPDDWVGWVEPGLELEGRMKATTGLIRLNSHLKGEIISEGVVVIHDQGEVEGDIQAKVVSVTGKVKGTIQATDRLEIKEHGIVLGDIHTPCLLVDPGGFFDGQCHMPTPEPVTQAANEPDAKEQT